MIYRKNIGALHQTLRVITGVATIAASLICFSNMTVWLGAGAGLMLIATGLLGYCPACAVAFINKDNRQ